MSDYSITWEDPDRWEETREQVYDILEKYTGNREYPETKSLPPIIIGIQDLPQEGVDELENLDGVVVRKMDDE